MNIRKLVVLLVTITVVQGGVFGVSYTQKLEGIQFPVFVGAIVILQALIIWLGNKFDTAANLLESRQQFWTGDIVHIRKTTYNTVAVPKFVGEYGYIAEKTDMGTYIVSIHGTLHVYLPQELEYVGSKGLAL